ncbi:hypothetical protein ACIHCQ_25265 [Streptomyces sp. NPDC052236]|uniref:hypothetical protein n=1 Tax=Streptomyces sp. NPDC052236 TaxID=3365686 RepID=UPI0037D0B57A
MSPELWRHRIARLLLPGVGAAVVVQCGVDWLRPQRLDLRNEIDEALITAQLRHGASLHITRVILHNIPASTSAGADADHILRTFDEWHYRLAAASALASGPAPQVHRLIIRGDQAEAPLPDMVELQENGRWSSPQNADLALRTIGITGTTTLLTSYDVDLSGPYSDGDPSVHM